MHPKIKDCSVVGVMTNMIYKTNKDNTELMHTLCRVEDFNFISIPSSDVEDGEVIFEATTNIPDYKQFDNLKRLSYKFENITTNLIGSGDFNKDESGFTIGIFKTTDMYHSHGPITLLLKFENRLSDKMSVYHNIYINDELVTRSHDVYSMMYGTKDSEKDNLYFLSTPTLTYNNIYKLWPLIDQTQPIKIKITRSNESTLSEYIKREVHIIMDDKDYTDTGINIHIDGWNTSWMIGKPEIQIYMPDNTHIGDEPLWLKMMVETRNAKGKLNDIKYMMIPLYRVQSDDSNLFIPEYDELPNLRSFKYGVILPVEHTDDGKIKFDLNAEFVKAMGISYVGQPHQITIIPLSDSDGNFHDVLPDTVDLSKSYKPNPVNINKDVINSNKSLLDKLININFNGNGKIDVIK